MLKITVYKMSDYRGVRLLGCWTIGMSDYWGVRLLGCRTIGASPMLPVECFFIWQNGFRGEDFFRYRTNQKQELPMAGMFVNGSGRNAQSL